LVGADSVGAGVTAAIVGLPYRDIVLTPGSQTLGSGLREGGGVTYQFVTCRFARVGVAKATRAEASVVNCMIKIFFGDVNLYIFYEMGSDTSSMHNRRELFGKETCCDRLR
jgi:hypothetical protein